MLDSNWVNNGMEFSNSIRILKMRHRGHCHRLQHHSATLVAAMEIYAIEMPMIQYNDRFLVRLFSIPYSVKQLDVVHKVKMLFKILKHV